MNEIFSNHIINKDILTCTDGAVFHGCNINRTFGAGLALAIKKKWPAAYQVDLDTLIGNGKLGQISWAKVAPNLTVFNLYQQSLHEEFLGGRRLNYNAFYEAFNRAVNEACRQNIKRIYVPYGIGCGLAGGNWAIVSKMMHESLYEFSLTGQFFVCRHEA